MNQNIDQFQYFTIYVSRGWVNLNGSERDDNHTNIMGLFVVVLNNGKEVSNP